MEGFIVGCEPRIQRTRSAIAAFSIALLCSACASSPDSGWTPIQGALLNPAQICSEDTNVYGLRTSLIYGKSADIYGIDFGLAGSAQTVVGGQFNVFYNRTEDFTGIQWGSYNQTEDFTGIQLGDVNRTEDFTGIQEGYFYNRAANVMGYQRSTFYNSAENLVGGQFSLFANRAEDAVGVRLTFVPGNSSTNFSGFEASMINTVDEQVKGVQLAMVVNEAGELKGVQLAGIHNKSESVVGLQIASLVNETENLRGVQIGALNFNRNGLIPFFPGINIGFGSSSEEATASDE